MSTSTLDDRLKKMEARLGASEEARLWLDVNETRARIDVTPAPGTSIRGKEKTFATARECAEYIEKRLAGHAGAVAGTVMFDDIADLFTDEKHRLLFLEGVTLDDDRHVMFFGGDLSSLRYGIARVAFARLIQVSSEKAEPYDYISEAGTLRRTRERVEYHPSGMSALYARDAELFLAWRFLALLLDVPWPEPREQERERVGQKVAAFLGPYLDDIQEAEQK